MIQDLSSLRVSASRQAGISLLLVGLALLTYVRCLEHPFVYDDLALVVENEGLHSLDPYRFLAGPSLTKHRVEWYRPLTLYSLALNHRFHGLRPFGYHLTNLLLHAINVFLVYQLARGFPGENAATLSAGLFAVHAVHVEAIAPVSGRADLLATTLALALWNLSIGWRQAGRTRLLLVAPTLLAALLAKESAIGAWPVALLFGALATSPETGLARPESKSRRRWLVLNLALLAAVAVYFGMRWLATGALLAPSDVRIRFIENPLSAASFPARVATALFVLARYAFLLIAPLRLSADYSYNQIPVISSPFDPRLAVVVLVLAGIGASLRLAWKRNPFGLLLLALLLLWFPVSNVPVTIGTIMAERLLYLPSVVFCLLAARAAASLGRRVSHRLVISAAALLVAAHTGRSVVRARDWRSQEALFSATARLSPESAKAHFNYGSELYRLDRHAEARRELEAALSLAPRYAEARSALAAIHLRENDLPAAEGELRRALDDEPLLASAWANLGMTLFRMGRDEESAASLERALALQPELTLALVIRGAVAERLQDSTGAIAWYRKAFQMDPRFDGLADHLADLLDEEGKVDEANRVRNRAPGR